MPLHLQALVHDAMAEVLLVDDDGSVLLTLAIALRRRGHSVIVAGDAAQALAHLQRRRFAFVISDVRMPGMSGVELAAIVRQMPDPPRVVLTSAFPSVENREGAAEAFLQKPINLEALAEMLVAWESPARTNVARRITDNHWGNPSSQDTETPPPLRRRTDWQAASG